MANEDMGCERVDTLDHVSAKKDGDLIGKVAFDLKGRAHVERRDNADGLYWIEDSAMSLYTKFPTPGQSSADALRKYLAAHLPADTITDEYGVVTPIEDVSSDHLTSLQARLWNYTPVGHVTALQNWVQKCGPIIAVDAGRASQNMPGSNLLCASHISAITELLDSNHIFVLPHGLKGTCLLASCHGAPQNDASPMQMAMIEPLIHWGTVTPAFDTPLAGGRILAFRRDGEKYDDPLWWLEARKIIPKDAATYCVGCVEMLMYKRAEAWAAVELNKPATFTSVNARQLYTVDANGLRLMKKLPEVEEHVFAVQNVGYDTSATTRTRLLCRPAMASLQLDGATDPVTPQKRSKSQARTVTPGTRRSARLSARKPRTGPKESNNVSPHSPTLEDSPLHRRLLTFPLTMLVDRATSRGDAKIAAWLKVSDPPCTSSARSITSGLLYSDTQPSDVPEYLRFNPNLPIPSEISRPSPDFSDDLTQDSCRKNTDSHRTQDSAIHELNMVIPKNAAKGTMDIRSLLPSAAAALPVLLRIDRTPQNVQGHITLSRRMLEDISSGSDLSSVIDISSDECTRYVPKPQVTPHKIKPLPKIRSPARPKADKPTGIFKVPALPKTRAPAKTKSLFPRAARKKPEGPFDPLRARYSKADVDPKDVPDTIDSYTYEDLHKHVPASTDTICSCHKPACTPDVQIAQCGKKECMISWYHYDCLDKSCKLKANHGTMVCQLCRNEEALQDFGRKNGFKMQTLLNNEFKMPFSRAEIMATLPGVGGHAPVVNPYGLGLPEVIVNLHIETAPKGSLGELPFFGFKQSFPHLLTEAYTNAQSYVAGADAAWAERMRS